MIQATTHNPANSYIYRSLANGCGKAIPAITSTEQERIKAAAFIQEVNASIPKIICILP